MRFRALAAAAVLLFAIATAADDAKKDTPEVTELLKEIAGKEDKPAGEVFKNVQLMKDVPAARFLRIMQNGYAQALGTDCEHCHSPEMWEADDMRPKRAAREMIVMTRELNAKLAKMENLDNTEPTVNCNTCHRGKVKPSTK
ncbi:MAG TPA: c-type cytochrome [Thermoanaerobaculia bacterium]|nr:c-type cytochrome [Thermoanaerobaculia bacterium]